MLAKISRTTQTHDVDARVTEHNEEYTLSQIKLSHILSTLQNTCNLNSVILFYMAHASIDS